jgi:hypothetical protein
MKFVVVPLEETTPYEKGIYGEDLLTTYGEILAPIIYEYCETSNPIVFDKNKTLIKKMYEGYISKNDIVGRRHAELFLYRIKKIIYLTDEFKKIYKWTNPMVIRDSIFPNIYAVYGGIDRWHVMKNMGVKEYEFLYLHNIEFSEDFKPKLQQLFTSNTKFEHFYSERSQRYQFNYQTPWKESPNFNFEKWLQIPYIENLPSAIVSQPNRVSLRDAYVQKMRTR